MKDNDKRRRELYEFRDKSKDRNQTHGGAVGNSNLSVGTEKNQMLEVLGQRLRN